MNINSLMLLTSNAQVNEYLETVEVTDAPGIMDFLFTGFGMLGLFLVVVLPIFLAVIPARIAKNKNRSFAGYYMFGYFALIPAIIVINLLKPIPKEETNKMTISQKAGKR